MISIIKKNKLLTLMLISYTGLIFISPEMGTSALIITKDNLLQLLMVMPIILAMTSLTKAWIPEELISKKLGNESGFLGMLLALILGSVSAGPIYAAFPFAKALLDKGASLRNITILLSSWAVIKVPMLANELAFLGPKFMITRWCLTVIAITILSVMLEKVVTREDILQSDQTKIPELDALLISADSLTIASNCTGCGVCLRVLPESHKNMIRINRGQAIINPETTLTNTLMSQLKRSCPSRAIS